MTFNRYVPCINTFYDNQVDAYVPQLWANESLIILEENMVAAKLVYRDFEPIIQDYGDTVNTRQPAHFVAIRKGASDDVTNQDAIATNVAVVLNQLIHVSFVIRDSQASKSFKDLVTEFLRPAMIAQAKIVDQCILGQVAQFLGNSVISPTGVLDKTTVKDTMLAARGLMNKNLAPETERSLLWSSTSETVALQNELFLAAYATGDGGNALQNATLGRKLGFDNYMSQDVPAPTSSGINLLGGASGAINYTAGYGIGTTTMTINGITGAAANNQWCTIGGIPYRIVSHTETAGNTTSITIASPGLQTAVSNAAIVNIITNGTVNNVGGYPAGYPMYIAVTGFTNFPVVGQFVTFGSSPTSPVYCIIQVPGDGTIALDRPLDVAINNGDQVNVGPAGSYNFAFHRNAVALISRPLALPPAGVGARAAVVNYNDVSMRALIAYDSVKQGLRVTLDALYGVKVLNTALGCVMLG
ncbi:MAG: hypothetical protein KGI50_06455 [Patescibacteria group bacterium]|nr:hypothetical protein [Patescibacteria group bacterium]MDE2439184.1 hypothetical protein [Patescibacteria group bacterium]